MIINVFQCDGQMSDAEERALSVPAKFAAIRNPKAFHPRTASVFLQPATRA